MDKITTDLRRTLARARRLGCRVTWKFRTGEIVITHPDILRPVRINGRRKDAPIVLLKELTQLEGRA